MKRRTLLMMLALILTVGLALAFSPDTAMAQKATEICNDGKDNDGDKLVDCKDPDCATDAACQKTGTGCSPGFYKNHTDIWVGICCDAETDPTCGEILDALTCKGSDASCGRSAAARFLDECTGCSE
ncbi:MAG: hypothetical protein ACREM3_08800 [Candidatus Rokuibacteriota bacterium]